MSRGDGNRGRRTGGGPCRCGMSAVVLTAAEGTVAVQRKSAVTVCAGRRPPSGEGREVEGDDEKVTRQEGQQRERRAWKGCNRTQGSRHKAAWRERDAGGALGPQIDYKK